MKNIFKKIAILIVVACFLVGCTPSINSKTTIKFASWGSKSEIDIIKPILSDFENKNPDIKIEFLHIPQNYFQKVHLLFASNTAPDVVFINNLYLPIYANAGVLEPIPLELVGNDIYEKNILQSLSWKGILYAVPRDVSNLVIFYNKDLFRKAGIDFPNPNWTFEDMLNICQKFKKQNIFGISFEKDALFFLPYLMSEGGGILSDDLSEIIIDQEKSQKGINFYANLRNKYHVAPLDEESASATMAQLFLQQKLGMHLTGRWLVPKYREEANFDWDIVSFPRGSSGSIVPLDSSGWAITKNSKHKIEAMKLIKFLSSKDSIQKITQSGLIVPARSDVAYSVYFIDNKKPEHAKIFLDVIKSAKPTPVNVNYREILDQVNEKLEKVF